MIDKHVMVPMRDGVQLATDVYRLQGAAPALLEPDAVYELHLNLWATANVFLPGHRIHPARGVEQ